MDFSVKKGVQQISGPIPAKNNEKSCLNSIVCPDKQLLEILRELYHF